MVDRDGKLVGLVYPDYEAVDKLGISISDMDSAMENVRKELNKIVAPYEQLAKIILMPTSLKRLLNAASRDISTPGEPLQYRSYRLYRPHKAYRACRIYSNLSF